VSIDRWTDAVLGDVALLDPEQLPSSTKPEEVLDYVSLEDVNQGRLLNSTRVAFHDAPSRARRVIRVGDVLFGTVRPNLKSHWLYDGGLKRPIVSTGFTVVRTISGLADPRFVFEFLMSDLAAAQAEQIIAGSNYPAISARDVGAFRLAMPPIDEQRAIAAALRDADSTVRRLERAIEKKEAMRTGLAQRLLTGEGRLPGFAKPWKTFTTGELGTFFKGYGIKRDDVRRSGVGCIRYGELYTTYHDYTTETVSFVAPTIAAGAFPLKSGDLLFTGSGETRDEIGKCVAFVGGREAVAGGDVIVFRTPRVNPIYLAALMNTPKLAAEKARWGQGDAVVHISSRALASIQVSLPERPEQDAVAGIIVDADNEINALRARLTKAKAVKQGMTQELLSGRTRLPVPERAAA
jgi:type I restriction enzyme, S subunit